jgi:hypothetical protein
MEFVKFLQEISDTKPTQARIDQVLGHLVLQPGQVCCVFFPSFHVTHGCYNMATLLSHATISIMLRRWTHWP